MMLIDTFYKIIIIIIISTISKIDKILLNNATLSHSQSKTLIIKNYHRQKTTKNLYQSRLYMKPNAISTQVCHLSAAHGDIRRHIATLRDTSLYYFA